MMTTDRKKAIRNIIIFAVLVNGLAWLGPVLGGVCIGLCENERFCSQMEEQKIYLNPGDLLLLYSDGVTEATNPQNDMFDLSGLKTAIAENAHESSEMVIGRINSRLHRFVKSNELQDDATIVAIKVK